MANVVVPVLDLDHHGWTGSIDQSQRSQHRGQHRAGVVAGLANQRFVFVEHAARRYRGNHANLVSGSLPLEGHSRLIDVERQRLLQTKADHGIGIRLLVGQSIEVQQHDARGGIGQHQADVTRTPGHRRQQIAKRGHQLGAIDDVSLLQSGSQQAGRQRRGRRRFQVGSAFADARRRQRGQR